MSYRLRQGGVVRNARLDAFRASASHLGAISREGFAFNLLRFSELNQHGPLAPGSNDQRDVICLVRELLAIMKLEF